MGTAARLSSDAEARAATRRTPPALAALEEVGAARTREDAEVAANIANACVACREVATDEDVARTRGRRRRLIRESESAFSQGDKTQP